MYLAERTPLISIIIPARNEGDRVRETILSFAEGRSRIIPIEVIVVDDASDDGCCDALEFLRQEDFTIRVIRLDNWSGIPFARNTGAAHATAPILFITDANVHAEKGWESPLLREIRPDRAICATIADRGSDWKGYGCLLDLPSMGIQWLRQPGCFGGRVPVMPSAGTVIPADLFRRLGGYDTAMPVYGAAEPELSVRCWLYGAEIIQVSDLVLHHHFKSPGERKPFLEQVEHLQIKNYWRFGLLYLDKQGVAAMFRHWQEIYPDQCLQLLGQLDKKEIAARRKYLAANLRYGFEWYCRLFGLPVFSKEEDLYATEGYGLHSIS